MLAWSQPDLPISDPTEPRILPQDGRAWFTVNWLSDKGRLTQQKAFEVDELETVLRLTQGQPNLYVSQSFFDRPVRRYPYIRHMTHAYIDCDSYRIDALAGRSHDAIARDIRLHCDDTGTPQPSAIIASGRGLYPKWYFSNPVGAEHVGDLVGANRALVRRLSRFGADPKATDPTRILRITGTLHTGANRMVEIIDLAQSNGRVTTFDAAEFCRTVAPTSASAPEPGTILPPVGELDRGARDGTRRQFTREGWHWAIVRDCFHLADMRWGGIVPEGSRDAFCFIIASQLARIVTPDRLKFEIAATIGRILPDGATTREMLGYCSTLVGRARDAFQDRNWTLIYRYRKQTLIDMLQITPAEERHMRALISDAEKQRRHIELKRASRLAAGMAAERAAWLAENATERNRPWLAEGISRMTWYRRRARAIT